MLYLNTAKFKRNFIKTLAKTAVSCMPKKYFSSDEIANKYMFTGDDKFSYNQGKYFTCGFGKRIVSPNDVTNAKYFIAGYDSNNPAQNILDPMYARAIFIDDNTSRGGIVICSIDAVGMSRKDINDIRRIVIESYKIPSLRAINICCTHTHSAIDTQGLWGEKITKSGINESFMSDLKKLTAEAIIESYESRQNGELFYAVAETVDMQFDCRTPDTYDKNLTKIHFKPFNDTDEIILVNFASHAELMGSKTKSVSADFPAYMIKEIESHKSHCEVIFVNGAIGGMISAREIKKVYRHEIDCEEYTKSFGKNLGEIVCGMTDEIKLSPIINSKNIPVRITAENFVLILARMMNVLNNDIGRTDKRGVTCILSEVGYIELGNKDIGVYLIPGELFPELYTGEFLDENSSATGQKANYKPLKFTSDTKHTFLIGLCNDELGYIIPDNDFYLHEETPYINNGKDKFDRKHYEETNSVGPTIAKTILDSIENLIKSVK